jgi:hypothetical protein
MWLCSQLELLTRSRLTLVSPSGQRAAVCLGSRHSPRLKSAIASSSNQRSKLAAYHDIHHRMLEWQQKHDPT